MESIKVSNFNSEESLRQWDNIELDCIRIGDRGDFVSGEFGVGVFQILHKSFGTHGRNVFEVDV